MKPISCLFKLSGMRRLFRPKYGSGYTPGFHQRRHYRAGHCGIVPNRACPPRFQRNRWRCFSVAALRSFPNQRQRRIGSTQPRLTGRDQLWFPLSRIDQRPLCVRKSIRRLIYLPWRELLFLQDAILAAGENSPGTSAREPQTPASRLAQRQKNLNLVMYFFNNSKPETLRVNSERLQTIKTAKYIAARIRQQINFAIGH